MRGLEEVRLASWGKPGNFRGLANLSRVATTGPIDWLLQSELRERLMKAGEARAS